MPNVTFWLNAFIPLTVTGYTATLPAGPHAGKTAVPLPGIARTWPGNWSKGGNAGYLGDQRGFSSLPLASVRMQSLAEVDPSGPTLVKQTHRSSGTTEVDLATGAQTGYAVANMLRCKFTVVPPPALPRGGGHLTRCSGRHALVAAFRPPGGALSRTLVVRVVGAAGDPLVGMAADIDYEGHFGVTLDPPGRITVTFSGKIDAFPAFECYASFKSVTKTLFTSNPPPGHTVRNLLGYANRGVSGSARFP